MDIILKTIVGTVVSIISWMVGGFGLVFTVLFGLMAIDFITGFLVAIYEKKLHSGTGIKGLIKKVYIILLIGSVYLIEVAVLGSNGIITDGVSAAFCIVEFVSIAENGGKLGVPLPNKLKDIIATLKNNQKVGE